jgi:uncharacterized HAD superfamily protein
MSFLEAKWFYNYALSQTNIFDSSIRKVNSVVVKKLEEFEERELKYISSQMKTGLHERIGSAIKMLSTKKKQGYFDKVGRLKFKKRS